MADLTGLGAVAESAKGILGMFFPDKTESERAQLAAALAVIQSQTDTNKEEAKSPSIFVSGWRPAIGWICGLACGWNWIGLPIAKLALDIYGHPITLAPADISEMMPILLGMLGLGGMRTFEKVSGVAAVTHK